MKRKRRGKRTIQYPATLLDWIRTYPMMARNPQAWFSNWHIAPDELRDCYEAGYHGVALALGYLPFSQPLEVMSKPIAANMGCTAVPKTTLYGSDVEAVA